MTIKTGRKTFQTIIASWLALATIACATAKKQSIPVITNGYEGTTVDINSVHLSDPRVELAYTSYETYSIESKRLSRALETENNNTNTRLFLKLMDRLTMVPSDLEKCQLLAAHFNLNIKPSNKNQHVSMLDAITSGKCDKNTFANLMLYSALRVGVYANNASVIVSQAKDPDRVDDPLFYAFALNTEGQWFVFESVQQAFAKGNDFNEAGAKLSCRHATDIIETTVKAGCGEIGGYINTGAAANDIPEKSLAASYNGDRMCIFTPNTLTPVTAKPQLPTTSIKQYMQEMLMLFFPNANIERSRKPVLIIRKNFNNSYFP